MRRRLVTGTALGIAGVMLLAACRAQPTSPLDGVRLEVRLSASELRTLGDSVVIHVVVTNPTATPRTIPWSACPNPFEIRDAAGGSVVPEDLWVCAAIARQRTLAPGESAELTGIWRGEMKAGPGHWISAPTGTYQVYGRLPGVDGRALFSPPVTLQVLAR